MNLILGGPPVAVRPEDRAAYIDALQQAQAGRGTASFERLLHERLDCTLEEYVSASREAIQAAELPPGRRDGVTLAP